MHRNTLKRRDTLPDAELNANQAKMLDIVQKRLQDYVDAVEYNMTTIRDSEHTGILVEKMEVVKKLEKSLRKGAIFSKEDAKDCPAMSCEILFGYSDAERKAKIQAVEEKLKAEKAKILSKCEKVSAGIKKTRNPEEKAKLEGLMKGYLTEAEVVKRQIAEIASCYKNKFQPPP